MELMHVTCKRPIWSKQGGIKVGMQGKVPSPTGKRGESQVQGLNSVTQIHILISIAKNRLRSRERKTILDLFIRPGWQRRMQRLKRRYQFSNSLGKRLFLIDLDECHALNIYQCLPSLEKQLEAMSW